MGDRLRPYARQKGGRVGGEMLTETWVEVGRERVDSRVARVHIEGSIERPGGGFVRIVPA